MHSLGLQRRAVAALSITLPSHFLGFSSWPDLTANICSHCSELYFSQSNTTFLLPPGCPKSALQGSLCFRAASHSWGGRGNFGAKFHLQSLVGFKVLVRHEEGLISALPLGPIPPPGFKDNSSAGSSWELQLDLLSISRGWR